MRSVSSAQETVLNLTNRTPHVRVRVKNADGTWIDYTDAAAGGSGYNWLDRAIFGETVDQPVRDADVTFHKYVRDGDNLAPLDETSPLNVDDLGSYAAALDGGREIDIAVATLAIGATPSASDYETLFHGEIDSVEWGQEQVRVIARDRLTAHLMDRWIEDVTQYGSAAGTNVETVIKSILTDWTDGRVDLWVVVNYLTASEDFSFADWTTSGVTVTTDATTAPDGTTTADFLEHATTNNEVKYAYQAACAISADNVLASFFAKDNGPGWCFINIFDSTNTTNYRAWFDLTNGVVGTEDAVVTASIEDYGDGWYRVSAWRSHTTGESVRPTIQLADGDGVTSYAGGAGNGIYVWGAQLERGQQLTRYKKTGTSALVPNFAITPYNQQQQPVWTAVLTLAQLLGWDLRTAWDDAASKFKLQFYEPDRDIAWTDWDFGTDDIFDIQRLNINRDPIRNVVEVSYPTSSGRATETASDSTSIARFGRRWMLVHEPSDSPINTSAEATALADAALADLKDPDADQATEQDFFWPVQVGDFFGFAADERWYSTAQQFAVYGFRHELSMDRHVTRLMVRGKPAGQYLGWEGFEKRRDKRVREGELEKTRGNDGRVGATHKDTSSREATGSTSEQTLETITIPARALGSDGGLRLTCSGTYPGINATKLLRFRLNGNLMASAQFAATPSGQWYAELLLMNDGSFSVQEATGVILESGGDVNVFNDSETEDSTADMDLTITGQVNDAADSVFLLMSHAEYVGAPE